MTIWSRFIKHIAANAGIYLRVLIFSFWFWFVYALGMNYGKQSMQAELNRLQQEQAAQTIAAEQAHAVALQDALQQSNTWQQHAQDIGTQLERANKDLQARANKNQQEIRHVIEQDRQAAGLQCIDGLGAGSLQLYRRALGYTD